jgi:hypothetical protein
MLQKWLGSVTKLGPRKKEARPRGIEILVFQSIIRHGRDGWFQINLVPKPDPHLRLSRNGWRSNKVTWLRRSVECLLATNIANEIRQTRSNRFG